MADGVDVSSNGVINSLLCYVMTNIKTLEVIRIKSTVVDHYCRKDISLAKKVLLEAASCLDFDIPLPRYPDRQSTNRTVKETDDIIDILHQVDERKMLNALPKFVTDNSHSLPSPRVDEGELRTLMSKMSKLEAILFGVQAAVHSVQSTMNQLVGATDNLGSTSGACVISQAGQSSSIQPLL